jgi:Zn-dependent M28 family amino/carboxypeptidase
MRAMLVGAILALVVAPAADAAKKKSSAFKLSGVKVSKSAVTAGDKVKVSGKAANRKGRKAGKATITYSLRAKKSAKSGKRLGKSKVKKTKGGKSRKFSKTLTVPAATKAGTYYLFACSKKACGKKKLAVKAKPGPGSPPPPVDTRNSSRKLRDAISSAKMLETLKALQTIADQHGGNRASGFQGYGASVEYIISQLRAAGYSPTTQVFDFTVFSELSDPVFEKTAPGPTVTYTEDDFGTMEYSGSGDVEAPVQGANDNQEPPGPTPSSSDAGCEPADFAGFTDGNIALVQRGTCDFEVKARNAEDAGASAVIIYNEGQPGRTDPIVGTLNDPRGNTIDIPVIGTSYAIGQQLRTAGSRAHVATNTLLDVRKSTNVLAETADGNANRVVAIGGHLDSVQEGPGINDNGSGSAFVLELARAMASEKIKPTNKVRFAFWGAEESGLVGSSRYVEALSDEEFGKLATYLNFDMLASPNHGKFVYDGDFSDTDDGGLPLNPGAARIEKEFVDYFNSVGIQTEPTAFDGRSDYEAFQLNGLATGGLFSGAEVPKTAEQAAKWGGTAGQAFDPNYHEAGDNITNLDLIGYEQLADGGAHVSAVMFEDTNLRNVNGGAAPKSRAAHSASRGHQYLGSHLRK